MSRGAISVCKGFLVIFFILSGITTASAADELFGAEPFEYSGETTEATEEWKNRNIVYEDWAEGADLTVSLDQHLFRVMLPLIKEYSKEKDLDIAVKEGTCGISSGLLSRKAIDIASLCCPVAKYDRMPGLTYHTVALGAIGIVVNEKNPIEDLTDGQVKALFSGQIAKWKDLDPKLPDLPVRPVGRLHCKTRPGHWRMILDNEDLFGENLEEVGTIPDMVRSVSAYAGAIGHLRTWNAYIYGNQWKVKVLKVNGISPDDKEALLRGQYPYYSTYNLATWEIRGKKNPRAEALMDYLMKNINRIDNRFVVASPAELRKAGWKFKGDELIAPPGGK